MTKEIQTYEDLDEHLSDDERAIYSRDHFAVWKRIVEERIGPRWVVTVANLERYPRYSDYAEVMAPMPVETRATEAEARTVACRYAQAMAFSMEGMGDAICGWTPTSFLRASHPRRVHPGEIPMQRPPGYAIQRGEIQPDTPAWRWWEENARLGWAFIVIFARNSTSLAGMVRFDCAPPSPAMPPF